MALGAYLDVARRAQRAAGRPGQTAEVIRELNVRVDDALVLAVQVGVAL